MMRKRAFTLVELMATLAILSLFLMMAGGIFVQSYKILNRTNSYSAIEDEFRIAILNIEKAIKDDSENKVVIYKDKKKIYLDNSKYPREGQEVLMCIIPKEASKEKTMYMQAENISGDIELIEINFTDADNEKFLEKENGNGPKVEILDNNPKVLISKIDTDNGGISFEENNGMININMPGIKKGNSVRANAYSGSIVMVEDSTIEISVNGESGGIETPDPEPPTQPEVPVEDKIIDILLNNIFTVLGSQTNSIINIQSKANGNINNAPSDIFYLQPLKEENISEINGKNGNLIELGNSNHNKWTNNYSEPSIILPTLNLSSYSGSLILNYDDIKKTQGYDLKLEGKKVGVIKKLSNANIHLVIVNGDVKINSPDKNNTDIEEIIVYTPGEISIDGSNNNIDIRKVSFMSGKKITWTNGASIGSIEKINLSEANKEEIKTILTTYLY